jgi:hypothetical protein
MQPCGIVSVRPEGDLAPPARGCRDAGPELVAEGRAVPVVPGSLDGGSDRRLDQAVRRRRHLESHGERGGERRRDERGAARPRVDASQLAVGPKAAEPPVRLVESPPDRRDRGAGSTRDDDAASHRAEDRRRHDWLVEALGGALAGATRPP